MSEKWRQSEICIVISHKSQGIIAKHLRNDELHYYTLQCYFQALIQGEGGRAPPPPSRSETDHQTSDQYMQPAMGFPDFSFCFESVSYVHMVRLRKTMIL